MCDQPVKSLVFLKAARIGFVTYHHSLAPGVAAQGFSTGVVDPGCSPNATPSPANQNGE